jgi:hypothetical protein
MADFSDREIPRTRQWRRDSASAQKKWLGIKRQEGQWDFHRADFGLDLAQSP